MFLLAGFECYECHPTIEDRKHCKEAKETQISKCIREDPVCGKDLDSE